MVYQMTLSGTFFFLKISTETTMYSQNLNIHLRKIGYHISVNGIPLNIYPFKGKTCPSWAFCQLRRKRKNAFCNLIRVESQLKEKNSQVVAQTVKNLPAMQEAWVHPGVRKISWRREWIATPVFLPGEFHGHRSLVGYSPWGCKEKDTTEQLTYTHISNSKIFGKLLSEIP